MASQLYETDPDWVPDATYINAAQGLEYIAWRVGIDTKRNKVLWLIAPVVDDPVDLTTLLPDGYLQFDLDDDVTRYGHLRSVLTKSSIEDLERQFLQEVDNVTTAIEGGFR